MSRGPSPTTTPAAAGRSRAVGCAALAVALLLALVVLAVGPRAPLRAWLLLPDLVPAVEVRPLRWITRAPKTTMIRFGPADRGWQGELYLPRATGPHPGLVIALGVAPAGPDDPRVVELADGMARLGFAALVPYSPGLVERRVSPEEIDFMVAAHQALAQQPAVDGERVGFFGLCVGASLALLAAADARIADDVRMIGWFGGYAELDRLVAEISAGAYRQGQTVVPWQPAPLAQDVVARQLDAWDDSAAARALQGEPSLARAMELVAALPEDARGDLRRLSPRHHVDGVRAPVYLMDDFGDALVPYVHTRQMVDALGDRVAAHASFRSFQHVDLVQLDDAWTTTADVLRLRAHVAAMLNTLEAEP